MRVKRGERVCNASQKETMLAQQQQQKYNTFASHRTRHRRAHNTHWTVRACVHVFAAECESGLFVRSFASASFAMFMRVCVYSSRSLPFYPTSVRRTIHEQRMHLRVFDSIVDDKQRVFAEASDSPQSQFNDELARWWSIGRNTAVAQRDKCFVTAITMTMTMMLFASIDARRPHTEGSFSRNG